MIYIYIGSCENIEVRLARHNNGYVKSTKSNRPWKLVGYERYPTRSEAMNRERFLKTGQQKERFRKMFKNE